MSEKRADPAVSLPGREGEAPARVLLIRHGASEGTPEGRFYGRKETALLPEGEAQVRETAGRAAPWCSGEVVLFCSPRIRARRSAEILREALPGALAVPPPEVIAELAEVDLGEWEGESFASLHQKIPERLAAHYADLVHSRPPGGESLSDLALRVRPAFASLLGRTRGKTALIVAHAAVNRVILCDALGVPLENFFRLDQDAAALNVLDFYEDGACVLRLMNG